jgi:bacterioferritin
MEIETELVPQLNSALARELQVCLQYMLQHAIGAGLRRTRSSSVASDGGSDFIASHSLIFLPGSSLKKIAITEMRHAEAIAERIVLLGGEPTTEPHTIALGKTQREMLENDLATEQEAIDLYTQIIAASESAGDETTSRLFRRILSDEQKHYRTFSHLLEPPPGRHSA